MVQSHQNYSVYLIRFSDKKLDLYLLNLFKKKQVFFIFMRKQQKIVQQ